ncbi:hypothetical protein [Nocardioides sp. NPDC127503]|uniref:hypothetical protein n=1 Tax=Nocardioides sp. NPDC127503 TaxID=3154516 RepID=UPI00331A2918
MFVLSGHGRTVLRDLVIYALRPTPNTVRICPDPGYLAGQRNKYGRLNASLLPDPQAITSMQSRHQMRVRERCQYLSHRMTGVRFTTPKSLVKRADQGTCRNPATNYRARWPIGDKSFTGNSVAWCCTPKPSLS